MKALRKAPGKPWELIEIENTLHALQHEVGGYIETYALRFDEVVICNEEGRLLGLPPSGFYTFVGTILLVGIDGEEFDDVPAHTVDTFCGT